MTDNVLTTILIMVMCGNLYIIFYGSFILDQNTGAVNGCLYLWKNCLVQLVNLGMLSYICCMAFLKQHIHKSIHFFAVITMLVLFCWDIYIWQYLDTCGNYYDIYEDLVYIFQIASVYNFALVGTIELSTARRGCIPIQVYPADEVPEQIA